MLWSILGSVGLSLLINECGELSPWLARRLVRWAARRQYRGSQRAEIRAEEWSRIIQDRPGKLFKLVTALWFATVALTHPAGHTRATHPLLPRLGRAAAQAGIAMAVASFVGCAELGLACMYLSAAPLEVYLVVGIMCAVPAALETLARGVLGLPQGAVTGGLAGLAELTVLVTLLTSSDPDAFNGMEIGLMLGMGLAPVFGVLLAVRLLARGRTGAAVFTTLQIVALGTFTAAESSSHSVIVLASHSVIVLVSLTAAAMVIGLTVGLGVTVGSRTLNTLDISDRSAV